MPGKSPDSTKYDAVTAFKHDRTVLGSDTLLDPIPVVDLGAAERTDAQGAPRPIGVGASNRCTIAVLLGAGVTGVTVAALVDAMPEGVDLGEAEDWSGRWVNVKEDSFNTSGVLELDGVFPGKLKVFVVITGGAGSVHLAYSRTE